MASGGADAYGVRNASSARPVFTDAVASGLGASATSTGVANDSGTFVTLNNVTVNASGPGSSFGIVNTSASSVNLVNVKALGSGTALVNQGSGGTVAVDRSTLGGAVSVQNGSGWTTRVAVSQLAGTVSNAGAISCFDSYSGSYVGLNAVCQ